MATFDARELITLAHDLRRNAQITVPQIDAVLLKTAVTIKGRMREDIRGSVSDRLRLVAGSIGFDVYPDTDGTSVEIGPEIGAGRANIASQGGLAFIGYDGTSRSGPVFPDPQSIIDDEEAALMARIADVAARGLL